MSLPAFAAALIGLTLLAAPARAAVIAQYTFDGGSAASTDTELNSTASDFLVRPNNDPSYWGFSGGGNVFAQSRGTTASEATAVTVNDHFSFTATPDSGFEMNLTTITFDTLHNATAGGGGEDINAMVWPPLSLTSALRRSGASFVRRKYHPDFPGSGQSSG